jgi:D-amino-acid oxidase
VSVDQTDVVVVGAGVCGLSTAVAVLEAGMSVAVFAAEPPHRTTSAAAGALWGPHLVGADDRIDRWAALTLRRFRELSEEPASGIRELGGLIASDAAAHAGPPAVARGAGPASRCDPAELPAGYASGWRYSAPVIDMPAYLDYLLELLLKKGGQLHIGQQLRRIAEAEARFAAPVIVNCAGIGARGLVPDGELTPVRGQVVIAANPGLTEFFVGQGARPDELTYMIPHGATIVLGGTEQHTANTRPDLTIAQQILARCASVQPRLAGVPVLAHRVGLRPVRPRVRLEVQDGSRGRHLVHNYGHGGAGVTLSWGCALEAAEAIAMLLGVAPRG